jgi:hypothetical protein
VRSICKIRGPIQERLKVVYIGAGAVRCSEVAVDGHRVQAMVRPLRAVEKYAGSVESEDGCRVLIDSISRRAAGGAVCARTEVCVA